MPVSQQAIEIALAPSINGMHTGPEATANAHLLIQEYPLHGSSNSPMEFKEATNPLKHLASKLY